MAPRSETTCPGCGLTLPATDQPVELGTYHASPECWLLNTEVIGREFGDAAIFGQVHMLSVDSYAVRHWAEVVWASWSEHHEGVGALVGRHLGVERASSTRNP